MKPVSFPIDFDRRSSIRLLLQALKSQNIGDVSVYPYRLWMEMAHTAGKLRLIAGKNHGEISLEEKLAEDPTVLVIEEFCSWPGPKGALVAAAVESEFYNLVATPAGGVALTSAAFWELNEHLLPGYLTIQQKGARARAASLQQERIEKEAQLKSRQLQEQGLLRLVESGMSQGESESGLALIMRIDRASGRHVMSNLEYSKDLLEKAVSVIRIYSEASINGALELILDSRIQSGEVRETADILDHFVKYVPSSEGN